MGGFECRVLSGVKDEKVADVCCVLSSEMAPVLHDVPRLDNEGVKAWPADLIASTFVVDKPLLVLSHPSHKV